MSVLSEFLFHHNEINHEYTEQILQIIKQQLDDGWLEKDQALLIC